MSREWAWRFDGGTAHGPFDSRDEALADAYHHIDGDRRTVLLGQVRDLRPEDHVVGAVDMESILEAMDERVELDYDDAIFEANGPDARVALEAVLRTWAQKYVTTNVGWTTTDEEDIEL